MQREVVVCVIPMAILPRQHIILPLDLNLLSLQLPLYSYKVVRQSADAGLLRDSMPSKSIQLSLERERNLLVDGHRHLVLLSLSVLLFFHFSCSLWPALLARSNGVRLSPLPPLLLLLSPPLSLSLSLSLRALPAPRSYNSPH